MDVNLDYYVGAPYQLGGRGTSWDCWTLVVDVLKGMGCKVPDLWDTAELGRTQIVRLMNAEAEKVARQVERWDVLLTGDIAADLSRAHVGVYISPAYVLHADRQRGVVLDPLRSFEARYPHTRFWRCPQ